MDVTPPIGIYHRMWGAASHDRAEGVHRPLTATALVIGPSDPAEGDLELVVAIDHCLLRPSDMKVLRAETSVRTGFPVDRITFAFSHTHAGGHIVRARSDLPGGELIGAYLDGLPDRVAAAGQLAMERLQPVTISYARAAATCDLGQNRDFCLDAAPANRRFVCGLNPHAIDPLPVVAARLYNETGTTVASLVNYPCHPTTLAWDNRLISPDYVGALRETVEAATNAPCVFFLGACGDIGPKFGFVGDTEVADRNGRQLGYAGLSALESLGPPGTDYHFVGPVISGATIGQWRHLLHEGARQRETQIFRRRQWVLDLKYRPDLPRLADSQRDLDEFSAQEALARDRGDLAAEAKSRSLAERERRRLELIGPLPPGETYPYPITVWQIGDAFWIALEGEPYYALQDSLTRQFPRTPLIFVTHANGWRASYLPRAVDYEHPLYEVEVAILGAGALEKLTAEIGRQINEWRPI
jgi:hypothetical protein